MVQKRRYRIITGIESLSHMNNLMESKNFHLDSSEPFNEVLIYEISLIPYQFQLLCEHCGGLIDFRFPCFHQKDHPLSVSEEKYKKSMFEVEVLEKALTIVREIIK